MNLRTGIPKAFTGKKATKPAKPGTMKINPFGLKFITGWGQHQKFRATIRSQYRRLDVMVNSAASFNHTPLLEVTYQEWQGVLGINLTGPFLCTQEAARLMIEGGSGGTIINISDNSGLNPWKARPAHSISKAGVIMLTQVSALALAESKIRVNCVVPGPVLRLAGEPESVMDAIAAGLPIGHKRNLSRDKRLA